MTTRVKMSLHVEPGSTVPWLCPSLMVPREEDMFLLTGGDGNSVRVPASFLLALSPQLRDMMDSTCCPSGQVFIPSAKEKELKVVRQILTSGCSWDEVEEKLVWKVFDVLDLLDIEIKLVKVKKNMLENVQGLVKAGEVKEESNIINDEVFNSMDDLDDVNYEEFDGVPDLPVPDVVPEDLYNIDLNVNSRVNSPINIEPEFHAPTCNEKNDSQPSSPSSHHIPRTVQSAVQVDVIEEKETEKKNVIDSSKSEKVNNASNLAISKYPCLTCNISFKQKRKLECHMRGKKHSIMPKDSITETISHDEHNSDASNSDASNSEKVANSNFIRSKTLYSCNIGGKSYKQKQSLNAHIKEHSGNLKKTGFTISDNFQVFTCQTCSKSYKHKTSVREHILSAHLKTKFKCNDCGKLYRRKKVLRVHQKKFHEGNV